MINTPWMLWALLIYALGSMAAYAFELKRLERGPGGMGAMVRALMVFVALVAVGIMITLLFVSMSAPAP